MIFEDCPEKKVKCFPFLSCIYKQNFLNCPLESIREVELYDKAKEFIETSTLICYETKQDSKLFFLGLWDYFLSSEEDNVKPSTVN